MCRNKDKKNGKGGKNVILGGGKNFRSGDLTICWFTKNTGYSKVDKTSRTYMSRFSVVVYCYKYTRFMKIDKTSGTYISRCSVVVHFKSIMAI